MDHSDIIAVLLSVGVLLLAARILGETARRFGQPAVIGEILAGIVLGPTLIGGLFPDLFGYLFPESGPVAIFRSGITTLSVVMFLLAAGMEVDLSSILRLRNSAFRIGLCGMLVPFSLGFLLASYAPEAVGIETGANPLVFALFLGTAMSISALPVIAKTLMDLGIFRSDLGMVIIASAVLVDIIGWIIFGTILGLMQPGTEVGLAGAGTTIILTVGFAGTMVLLGRPIVDRVLPWVQANTSYPGGVLAFSIAFALFAAAYTEWAGIHAIFGAFIAGVVIGDSAHLTQRTRATLESFMGFVFAPLFFASIGLGVDFIANFDFGLVALLVVVASTGEIAGAFFGARWSGFTPRQSLSIGCALSARGAMEIVLALLALQYGVIGERLFVALVTMALVSSIIAGPLMKRVLQMRRVPRLRNYLTNAGFVPDIKVESSETALRQLAESIAPKANLSADEIFAAVWQREQLMTTAIANGLAIPHARLVGLSSAAVAVGIAPEGLPFDSLDGEPTKLIVMVITPADDPELQLQVLADIASTFRDAQMVERAVACTNITLFRALLNIHGPEPGHGAGPNGNSDTLQTATSGETKA